MTNVNKSDPVRVILELRVAKADREAGDLRVLKALAEAGIEIDMDYGSISVPPHPEQSTQLARSQAEAMIARAMIDIDQIALLQQRADILRVWRDDPIPQMPFTPSDRRAPCPIPPCDCTGGTVASGSTKDVANYLGVDRIWAAGDRGRGIVVGLVDCGVCAIGRTPRQGETAIIPNVIGGYPNDWGTTSRASKYWYDHGNMTATDVLGMAPEAGLLDIRITDGFAGHESILLTNAYAGFDWAIRHFRRTGTPHILSNSWGLHKPRDNPSYATDANHPLTRKIIEAIDAGIIVLFSAGNCGAVCPSSYCGDDVGEGRDIWGANGHRDVITVGAVNLSEQFVGYSSTGPSALDPQGIKPDFCSITQFRGYYPGRDASVACDAGTSAATAVAAGVTALLKERRKHLTPAQAKSVLRRTAKPLGPTRINQFTGAGIIRAKAAWDALGKCRSICEWSAEQAARFRGGFRRIFVKRRGGET